MTKTEKLLARMICLYSFEHPAVIQFAALIEKMEENNNVDLECLEFIVKNHENKVYKISKG